MMLYAVFHEGQQITNPMSFEDANYHAAGITGDQFDGDLSHLYEVLPATDRVDIKITEDLEALARAIAQG